MTLLRPLLAAALVACTIPVAQAVAQSTGIISGVVRDGQLRPMAAVEVNVAGWRFSRTVRTDSAGNYRVPGVPRGRTLVIARREGYSANRRSELVVRPGETHDVEIVLYDVQGNPNFYFDPEVNRPINFASPRGFAVATLGNVSSSTLAIGSVDAGGTAWAGRVELANEIDSRWMVGIRGGLYAGSTSRDVAFRYNAQNTITYRNYSTSRYDMYVRYSPLTNTQRIRPYGSGSFGISKFRGDVRVTTLEDAQRTDGNGLVVAVGAGAQFNLSRALAIDAGVEWSGASFEEWRIAGGLVGLPNLRVYGTDFVVAVRWWPWSER